MLRHWNRQQLLISGCSAGLLVATASLSAIFNLGPFSAVNAGAADEGILVSLESINMNFDLSPTSDHVAALRVSVANRTGQAVKVAGIETSCSCTAVKLVGLDYPVEVPDGDEVELPLEVSVSDSGSSAQSTLQILIDNAGRLQKVPVVLQERLLRRPES